MKNEGNKRLHAPSLYVSWCQSNLRHNRLQFPPATIRSPLTRACTELLPYFPEYKSHFLSRNLLEICEMRLILRMREKGGVTVNFTHAHAHVACAAV